MMGKLLAATTPSTRNTRRDVLFLTVLSAKLKSAAVKV